MQVNQVIGSVGTKEEFKELLIVQFSHDLTKVAISDLTANRPRRPQWLYVEYVKEKIKRKEWQIEEHEFPCELYQPDSYFKEKFLEKQLAHFKSKAKSKSKELKDPIEMRDESWTAIKPLIDNSDLLERYLFGDPVGIVKELMEVSGKDKKFITQALNKYFYFGGMRNALLPNYHFCGKNFNLPEKPILLEDGNYDLSSKPGPVTKHGNQYRSVTQKDVYDIEKFIKANVRNGQEVVKSELYADYIADFCSVNIRPKGAMEEDIICEFKMKLERRHLISPRAFRRQIDKQVSNLIWLKKKVGAKNYLRDHASKTGVAKHGLRGATSRYEIDSTIIDMYIRYEFSNELLSIGRPILYLVIDVVTSMIVGMHVAYHGPDWTGASQALLNAFSDKVEFCEKYGIKIKPEDWPCHHPCRELTADRGTENSDNNMESILKGKVGVSVVNLNAYHQGSAKGTVEKSFDTIQSKALSFEAGKVMKYVRHEDKHASRRALWTHGELMKALIKTVLHANNNEPRVNARTFEMERDGVAFSPRELWNYSLERNVIVPEKLSRDKLIFALMRQGNATIRAQGVYFQGLFYTSKDFERTDHIENSKNFGRNTIKVRYTDTSTNAIWWRDEKTKKVYQLDLTERSEAYKNLTWATILHRLEILKHELALAEEESFMSAVLLKADLRALERAALRKTRKLKKPKAKSIASGTKERFEAAGELQKANYQKDIQAAFAPTDNNVSVTFKVTPTQHWGNPNAVELEVANG